MTGRSSGHARHIVRRLPWATIDLDVVAGHVLVRQTWQYSWEAEPGMPAWSHDEMVRYCKAVERLIWSTWSHRARLLPAVREHAKLSTLLVRQFGKRGLDVTFDVKRVKAGGQWQVIVTKVDPARRPLSRAQVDFLGRTILLYNTDMSPRSARRFPGDQGVRAGFMVTPHEFGHALDADDERSLRDPLAWDTASLMNIGTELRPRHLWRVAFEVSKMAPACRFSTVIVQR